MDNNNQDGPVHGHSKVTGTDGAAPAGMGKLPWIIGGLLLLGLLLLLMRSCSTDPDTVAVDTTPTNTAVTTDVVTVDPYDRNRFDTYVSGTEPIGRSFALDKVTFATGSSTLDKQAANQINDVAASLRARPTTRIALRGYADPAGDAGANLKLSQQRVNAVTKALVAAGVGAAQIVSAAEGETGTTAVRDNRRVELAVTAR